jgi:hypothetical protein
MQSPHLSDGWSKPAEVAEVARHGRRVRVRSRARWPLPSDPHPNGVVAGPVVLVLVGGVDVRSQLRVAVAFVYEPAFGEREMTRELGTREKFEGNAPFRRNLDLARR